MGIATKFENQLGAINDRIDQLSKKFGAHVDRVNKERRNGESVELTKLQKYLNKTLGPELSALQQQQKKLEQALDALELTGSKGAGARARRGDVVNPGAAFTASDEYKHFIAARGQRPNGSAPANVRELWGQKAPSLVMDETALGALVIPYYRPGLTELPKNMPILREYVPVLPIPATNLVKVDREVSEALTATTVTATVNATDTTAALTSVSGLSTETGFNEITFDNGTTTHTAEISDITDLTVTFSPAIPGGQTYTAANTRVTSRAFTTTSEGALKPQGYDVFQDYDVPVVTLAQWISITTQKLSDIPSVEDAINRRLLNRLARMEDLNCFYGSGASGQPQGIFTDADVPALGAYSTQDVGDNEVDYLLNAYYALAEENYVADLAIVRPVVHKRITKMKGSDQHYIFFRDGNVGAPERILTMALRWSNQLVGNDAVVGDFGMSCTLYDRQDATISIGMINDDMVKNRRTILGEQRFGFGIELPRGLRTLSYDVAGPITAP